MYKKFHVICLLFCLGGTFFSMAQDQDKTYLGASVQLYPAGIIPTINLEHFIEENASWVFRLGANVTDRKDFSKVNDSEEGEGFGGTVGFRKHFPSGRGKFIAGVNLDVWSMNIDWRDTVGGDVRVSGSTYILVLQPWLEGGYFLPIKNIRSQLGLTLGLDQQINAITNGEKVEQGLIGSVLLKYKISL